MDLESDNLVTFDASTDAVLVSVMKSNDPLDSPDFDPVAYINEKFPDEEALSNLNTFTSDLNKQIHVLGDQILSTVREQSSIGKYAEQDLEDAKNTINDLFERIVEIKSKATLSEGLVQIICKDISKLDAAKRNLTKSLNSLAKMQMFVSSITKSEEIMKTKKYIKGARHMGAIMQLSPFFEKYKDIETIQALLVRVNILRDTFTHSIFTDFDQVSDLVYTFDKNETKRWLSESELEGLSETDETVEENMVTHSRLQAACYLIDALGVETRDRLIKSFCAGQIKNYEQLYGPESKGDNLEQMDRRYHWFWKCFADYEAKYIYLFPYVWHVGEQLVMAFCDKTREHCSNILKRWETPELVNVPVLVAAMRITMEYERQLIQRLDLGSSNVPPDSFVNELDDEGNVVDVKSAHGVQLRYERQKKKEERENRRETEKKRLESEGKVFVDVLDQYPRILGYISSVFEPYLKSFVNSEKQNFDRLLSKLVKDEDLSKGMDLPVLQSAVKLFNYMKETITRCSTLSTGDTFILLCKEVNASLLSFGGALSDKLPKAKAKDSFNGECVRFKKSSERDYVCYCINTAAFVSEMIPQLESLAHSLTDPSLREQICFQSLTLDCYFDTISCGIKILVSGIYGKIEQILYSMTSVNWGNFVDIGDQSTYIVKITKELREEIPAIRNLLNFTYFRNFCDRLANMFLPRFLDCVGKCKKVNEMGAQQLLLDLHSLKNTFLKLPTHGQNETDLKQYVIPTTYIRFVNRSVDKADKVLKLLGTPVSYLITSFHEIMPEGTEDDLLLILTVKGVTKKEKMEVLSQLSSHS